MKALTPYIIIGAICRYSPFPLSPLKCARRGPATQMELEPLCFLYKLVIYMKALTPYIIGATGVYADIIKKTGANIQRTHRASVGR